MANKKWGVWLNNFVNRRDDEWTYVWAPDYMVAHEKALKVTKQPGYYNRFGVSDVMQIKEFRKLYPITKNFK